MLAPVRPKAGRPIGRLAVKVIRLLLRHPMTATALAKQLNTTSTTMFKCLNRLYVDKHAVTIAGTALEEGCKKPVRLYLTTAKGLAIISGKEKE